MKGMLKLMTFVEDIAMKTKTPLETVLIIAVALEKQAAIEEHERSATSEEKEKINQYLGTMNGNISEDMPPEEICVAAGVRSIQGTKSFIRYQVKQLLLEHKN
jgi:hypothetical protein